MRHPLHLGSNSRIHLAVTHCCAPSKHGVRGPCSGKTSGCRGSLRGHCGRNRFTRDSDVSFPSSLGCAALVRGHAICNNKKVFPSVFIPLSAAHCSACCHAVITGKIFGAAVSSCVSGGHGSLLGGCPSFTSFGDRFRIPRSVVFGVVGGTGGRGVRCGRTRFGRSRPVLHGRVGTMVTRSLCNAGCCFRMVRDRGSTLRRTVGLFAGG